ncbi:Hypothetical predicted protein, partial [Paramuricea clavata]
SGHVTGNRAAMVVHAWTTVDVICVLVLKDGQARTVNKTLIIAVEVEYHFFIMSCICYEKNLLTLKKYNQIRIRF